MIWVLATMFTVSVFGLGFCAGGYWQLRHWKGYMDNLSRQFHDFKFKGSNGLPMDTET